MAGSNSLKSSRGKWAHAEKLALSKFKAKNNGESKSKGKSKGSTDKSTKD